MPHKTPQTRSLTLATTSLETPSQSPFSFSDSKRNRRINGHNRRQPSDASAYSIILHCHLCWDWVWQRPQQFLSRLSQRHRVLFVEMHPPDENLVTPTARLHKLESFPNITLLQMQFPVCQWSDGHFVDQRRRELLHEALKGPLRGQFEHPVQWFYDPMAVTAFAGQMGEICTVY